MILKKMIVLFLMCMYAQINGTIEQKIIGQHIIIGLTHYPISIDTINFISQYNISGVIFVSDNYKNANHIKAAIDTLKFTIKHPLFFCIDQEGGSVQRIKTGVKKIPSAHYIATHFSPQEATYIYNNSAKELHNLGINVNFAPVVDVNTNANNTVIGSRSYGNNPFVVTTFASIAAQALTNNQILPVIKHFPGHGQTAKDSHVSRPTHTNQNTFYSTDLFPFTQLIEKDIPAIMIGHVLYPFLDPKQPASLSSPIIQNLLRKKLNFKGLIFSDDLSMGSLSNYINQAEAITTALKAGIQQIILIDDINTIKNSIRTIATNQATIASLNSTFKANIAIIQDYKLRYQKK